MASEKKNHSPEDLQRIQALRLIDDDFMNICFDDYIEGAELLLRIILDRDDLKVSEVRVQKKMTNNHGRNVYLDIYASDRDGTKYDIEVQRANEGAHKKRARYHSVMIDSYMLDRGEDFTDLRENYVIFITEHDVFGENEPIYHLERVITESNVHFDDGEHIIYVNASMKSKDTALGRLMSDFYCTNTDDMCYKELSDRVKLYKETEEGVNTVCDILEEMKNETAYIKSCEIAFNLIKDGTLSLEKIAECSGLSIEKVRELAGNKSA